MNVPADIVRRAIEEAQTRDALVRAMALLAGSRVLAAADRAEGAAAFAEAVAALEAAPLNPHQRDLVLDDAVRLGASVNPAAAVALYRRLPAVLGRRWRRSTGMMLIQGLAQSGEWETAIELLEDAAFDTGGAGAVLRYASDPGLRHRALRAARRDWRQNREPHDPEFNVVFSQHWRILEAAEAEDWLDESLRTLETDPNPPVSASFGGRVELHSMRDLRLVYLVDAVRALKPPGYVDAILWAHPGVEQAARTLQPQPAPGGSRGGGFLMASGSESQRRLMPAVQAAWRGEASAIQDMFAEAHRLFRVDADPEDPNAAPRVFWPSCHAYETALYWAGKLEGRAAEARLAAIPDGDFALLASIEMAGECWAYSSTRGRGRNTTRHASEPSRSGRLPVWAAAAAG